MSERKVYISMPRHNGKRFAKSLLEEFLCQYQNILLSREIDANEAVRRQNELIDEYAERIEMAGEECEFVVVKEFVPGIKHRGDICECSNCGYRCAYGLIEDERFERCPRCGAKIKAVKR